MYVCIGMYRAFVIRYVHMYEFTERSTYLLGVSTSTVFVHIISLNREINTLSNNHAKKIISIHFSLGKVLNKSYIVF